MRVAQLVGTKLFFKISDVCIRFCLVSQLVVPLLAWAFRCELRTGIARNLRAPIAHSQRESHSQFLDEGLQSQRIGHSLLVLNKASGRTAQISCSLQSISEAPIDCGYEQK